MGRLNLLKGAYEGKVGQTSGTKWKGKKVIKTYTTPTDPKTEAQEKVRKTFGDLASFTALFTGQLKYLSALNTRDMTVRNAIIKLNKDQIDLDNFDPTTMEISKGGLPKPVSVSAAWSGSGSATGVTLKATLPDSSAVTHEAKLVAVAIDYQDHTANVVSVPVYRKNGDTWEKVDYATTGIPIPMGEVDTANDAYAYIYVFDKHGTSKVGSFSVGVKVTA